jgi:hypothetical protein
MTAAGGLREALPLSVSACLTQLSVTLHKYRAYPVGHPMRVEARENTLRLLEAALSDRSTLRIGVARRQLLVDDQATDSGQPVLRELAERLHRRQIGAVVFRSGLTAEELEPAIDRLNANPRLGSVSPDWSVIGPHVELIALSYTSLALAPAGAAPAGGPSADELWTELARLAMVPDAQLGHGGSELVARAMAARGNDPAFWSSILPALERFGRKSTAQPGAEGAEARRGLTALLDAIPRETLIAILGIKLDTPEGIARLLDASEWLALPALLDMIEEASKASGQSVSHFLLRLMRKLSERGGSSGAGDAVADLGVREGIRSLLSGWTLADPNPWAHTQLLEQLSAMDDGAGGSAAEGSAESGRIVRMALEVDGSGVAVADAAGRMLEQGELPELLNLLDAVPATNAGAAAIRRRLIEPETLRRVLLEEPVDHAACGRLLQWATLESVEGLLDSLTISEAPETRWLILRRLSELGPEVVPLLVERLDAAPWYLKRNLLGLLADLPSVPFSIGAERYANDPEPLVRREAYRVMIRSGGDRDGAIHRALADPDEPVIRAGLEAATKHGLPRASLPRLMKVLNDPARLPELRARGIALLEQFDSPVVRQWLVEHAMVRRGFFRRTRLAPKSPELLAGIAVLARLFRSHPQAAQILRLAAASGDPELVEAAREQAPA